MKFASKTRHPFSAKWMAILFLTLILCIVSYIEAKSGAMATQMPDQRFDSAHPLFETLPWSVITFFEGERPSSKYGSKLFRNLAPLSPLLKKQRQKSEMSAGNVGLDPAHYDLNIEFGAARGPFGYLEYFGGPINLNGYTEAFRVGYAHYGTTEAVIEGHSYVYVDKKKKSDECSPAFTAIAGGILEGGKRDIERVLKKKKHNAFVSEKEENFRAALPLIELGADEFGLFWGDRETVKIRLRQVLDAGGNRQTLFSLENQVAACGYFRVWGKSLKVVTGFLFRSEEAARLAKAYVVQNGRKIAEREIRRLLGHLFGAKNVNPVSIAQFGKAVAVSGAGKRVRLSLVLDLSEIPEMIFVDK